ncbi:UDP-glucose 4-epimerase GalE [Ferrimonas marina]|uniref:UDP-glucose 4-epimerase n=1 Tax=Ferrimonas marina TaxID=299255 RepID=A0A1M5RTG1_9GAMM|nr:UDP-glucose 4-epimerase GalE [Ferrimonas marina]SHH29459.1 UDP-glucose 4-epimerase [Ferrimonas marina]
MAILVTGGAGYIGSHAVVELLNEGHSVVVLDNLCNSSKEALRRVEWITGKRVRFYQGDVTDIAVLRDLFGAEPIDAVMHFAGLKSVNESLACPLEYYRVNVGGTQTLCQAMEEAGVHTLVFSSSATVYGVPQSLPLDESAPVGATTNPYGTSKFLAERILTDLNHWHVAILRYFNPVGAHPSGLIGEDPLDAPNNLMPYISQVACGRRPCLSIYGDDYDTQDGTGVRDYIHVVDLVQGHLRALQHLQQHQGVHCYNLGTGQGHSVMEMVQAFEQGSHRPVPYKVCPRRPGDVASCYANPSKAARELGWRALRGLNEMVFDSWRWQQQNPQGYAR